MAVDHAKHTFVLLSDPAPFEFYFVPADFEGGSGDSGAWWVTRAMTHTVAVGFALALGVGFFFLFASRARLGWTRWQLLRYYALRAAVLVVLEQILVQCMALCLWIRGDWPGYLYVVRFAIESTSCSIAYRL
jgi:hypothetical protein